MEQGKTEMLQEYSSPVPHHLLQTLFGQQRDCTHVCTLGSEKLTAY